jgi:hypothetical protein
MRSVLSPMRASYGEVILSKGTRLYHTSGTPMCERPDKPMLFLTLHPSEWYRHHEDYVSVFELQRDVSLFFMVQGIRRLRVFSALNLLLNKPGDNLMKMRDDNITCYKSFLEREHFDGWFSTIEGKTAVEVALLNHPAVYKLVDCSPIQWNWRNSRIDNNGKIIPKMWGNVYPVGVHPARLTLNAVFQSQLDEYRMEIERDDPGGTAFSRILETAEIRYIDAPVQPIRWC